MEFKLRKPIGYSHIGRKDQQEDAVWPLFEDVTADNRCIVLCDGVGGSEHGEVASQNSSRIIGEHLSKAIAAKGVVEESDVQIAVEKAYAFLESIDKDGSEDRCTMATTLTCVCLHGNGVLAAHMGDSRIYHVRPNVGILYRSADHSLVQALLQAGELTPEEAKTFPRKNVITKAIQPHSAHLSAEVQNITDVKSGDYLFLCCDGVLENLTDERLTEVLSMTCSDAEKLKLIEAESIDKTRDNYTAYLIPIEKVEGEVTEDYVDQTEYVEITHVEKSIASEKPEPATVPLSPSHRVPVKKESNKKTFWQYLIAALIIITLIVIAIKNWY
ncbi:MAG: protein phosphatase 2C domain-containing protein [Bacteroidaceae bacterium]|nr:protein phosphatase 2C domain-containing protein [Bacteroidaceae bacterium]